MPNSPHRVYCLIIVLFYSIPGYSQNQGLVDSLENILDTMMVQSPKKFIVLQKLAHNHPDITEALNYSFEAYHLATQLEELELQAKALEEISANQRLLGNLSLSTEASLKALELFEILDNFEAQAAVFGQLGSNAVNDRNYPEAIKYFTRALGVYENLNTSLAKFNHSLTQLNLGESYRLSGQLQNALTWFTKSLNLRDSIQESYRTEIVTAYATGNLGMVYNSLDQLDTARAYLSEAITLTRKLGDPYTTSVYLADLGVVEQKEGNHSQAEAYLLEAHEIALVEGLKEQIRDISELLVNFYEDQKQYGSALAYQKIYQQYQDSLVNRENVQQVEQLKANYEINKRESEIDLLTTINDQQRSLAVGLGVGLIMVFSLALVIYRTNGRLKQSNQNLSEQKEMVSKREEEKGWLLHELNHRVKNNMQMIASLLSLQEGQLKGHPAEAAIAEGKYRVKALSLIHRKLYQEDHHTEIVLEEYLEELAKNLVHGFGNQVNLKLELSSVKLHIDKAVPLALIVNECITNALKYAYKGIEAPELLVRSTTFENQISILIQDNGIGFSVKQNMENSGFGSLLVQQLVGQLEGTIVQVPDKNGTTWELKFFL